MRINYLKKHSHKAGLFAGIIFCLIGIINIIPAFGIAGVLWTAAVLLMTVMNGFYVVKTVSEKRKEG